MSTNTPYCRPDTNSLTSRLCRLLWPALATQHQQMQQATDDAIADSEADRAKLDDERPDLAIRLNEIKAAVRTRNMELEGIPHGGDQPHD